MLVVRSLWLYVYDLLCVRAWGDMERMVPFTYYGCTYLLRVGAWGAMERINATPLPFAYVVLLRTFLVLSTSWRGPCIPFCIGCNPLCQRSQPFALEALPYSLTYNCYAHLLLDALPTCMEPGGPRTLRVTQSLLIEW